MYPNVLPLRQWTYCTYSKEQISSSHSLTHEFRLPTLPQLAFIKKKIDTLAFRLSVWTAIPDVSSWVPNTIQRGYSLQFSCRLPHFMALCLRL